MQLSEFKGEEAIEVLADIIEPAARIMGDVEVKKMYSSKLPIIKVVSYVLKEHKKEALTIVARLEGVDEEDVNLFTLPKVLIEAFNDPLLVSLFQSATQNKAASVSGLRTENTEASAK